MKGSIMKGDGKQKRRTSIDVSLTPEFRVREGSNKMTTVVCGQNGLYTASHDSLGGQRVKDHSQITLSVNHSITLIAARRQTVTITVILTTGQIR